MLISLRKTGFLAVSLSLLIGLAIASPILAQGKGKGGGGGSGGDSGGGGEDPPPPTSLPRYEWVMITTGPYGTGEPTFGGSGTVISDMNNNNIVVGTSSFAPTVIGPYRWTESTGMRDLNDELDPNELWRLTSAEGINDAGQITGRAVLKTGPSWKGVPYRLTPAANAWEFPTLQVLPLQESMSYHGRKINNFGDVIGGITYDSTSSAPISFLWKADGDVVMVASTSVPQVQVQGINDLREVIGYDLSTGPRAIFWSEDVPNVINFPLGNTASRLFSLNQSGQFVGQMRSGRNAPWSAIVHDGIQLVNLTPHLKKDDAAAATDINNNGDVVGWQITNSGTMIFVRIGTDLFDIRPQIEDFPVDILFEDDRFNTDSARYRINNHGTIAGTARVSGGFLRGLVLFEKP